MTGASTTTATMRQRWQAVMMNNYGTPPIALASGDGAVVTDVDGRTYIDLLGGIAVNVLGHRHPAVIEAVTRQMSTLGHTSNLYATEPGIALAEELVALLGADQRTRVFFCNSGAEANEAAFKLSRLTGRTKLVAAHDAFHSRTCGPSRPSSQRGDNRCRPTSGVLPKACNSESYRVMCSAHPPATAGRMVTESPSAIAVAKPPENRTSSSLT